MLPEERISIQIADSGGKESAGVLVIQRWDKSSGRKRAFRLTAGIAGRVFLLPFVAIFVHILIIPTLIALSLTVLGSPFLFMYFLEQKATFLYAEGQCPHCQADGKLNPYLWRTLAARITLLCPGCGQSSYANVGEEDWIKSC